MSNPTLENVKNLAFLSNESYKTAVDNVENKNKEISKKQPIPNPATNSSFQVVAQVNDDTTGFSGTVFKDPKTGEYTIAFRGTEISDVNDLSSDAQMALMLKNKQFQSAKSFADEQINAILANDPNAKINLTGHSLGGTLAQYIAYEKGLEATTFNAYGGKKLIEEVAKANGTFDEKAFSQNSQNVVNIINPSDVIATSSGHYGKNFVLNYTDDNLLVNLLKAATPFIFKTILDTFQTIFDIYEDHSMDIFLQAINNLNEEDFKKLMSSPYENDAIIDAMHELLDLLKDKYKDLEDYADEIESLIDDVKSMSEEIYDKFFTNGADDAPSTSWKEEAIKVVEATNNQQNATDDWLGAFFGGGSMLFRSSPLGIIYESKNQAENPEQIELIAEIAQPEHNIL